MSDEKTTNEVPRPTLTLKLFGWTLTGAAAALALLVIVAAIVAVVVLIFKPTFRMSPMWVSAVLWIAFIVIWSAAAANSTETKSAESTGSRQLHQNLLNLGLLLLFLPVPGLRRRWLPDAPSIAAIGLALQTACALLAVWARRHLGRNWSGAITEKVDHELVRSGPYRIVRHPIYSAMLGMFLGTAIVSGALHALAAVVLIVAAYVRKIRLEERTLRAVFGAEYDAYRSKSRALIPGLF